MRRLALAAAMATLTTMAATPAPIARPATKPAGTLAQLMRGIYLVEACSNCHEVYRDKGPADSPARCTPAPNR